MALISSDALAKRYGEVTALSDLSVDIEPGVIGLIGANGAGKSTLIKILLGLVPATSGTATVLGLDVATDGAEIRSRVGYMPEQEAFLAGMSAVELCAYAAELSGLPKTEAIQRAHAALTWTIS